MSSKKIGIIGLGLIGGSIARALKRAEQGFIIKAWDKDERNIKSALDDYVIDEHATLLKNGFADCQVIFLCVPVFAMKGILEDIKDNIPDECILTDVGSTKSDIIAIIKEMNIKNPFVGGHPLTGSERSGFVSSRANLFENAYYCLTPLEDTDKSVLLFLKELITSMGAIPIEMTPSEHDRVTAAISHVPHIIAALLVNMVDDLDGPDNIMKTIAAGGFKDITRIASSSSKLWTGICFSNRERIVDTLNHFIKVLKCVEMDLTEGNKDSIEAFFVSAKNLRNSLSDNKSQYQKTFDIAVDVDDRPGIIAEIATAFAKKNINIKNIGILNSREADEGALEIRFENEASRQQGLDTLASLGYSAKSRG